MHILRPAPDWKYFQEVAEFKTKQKMPGKHEAFKIKFAKRKKTNPGSSSQHTTPSKRPKHVNTPSDSVTDFIGMVELLADTDNTNKRLRNR